MQARKQFDRIRFCKSVMERSVQFILILCRSQSLITPGVACMWRALHILQHIVILMVIGDMPSSRTLEALGPGGRETGALMRNTDGLRQVTVRLIRWLPSQPQLRVRARHTAQPITRPAARQEIKVVFVFLFHGAINDCKLYQRAWRLCDLELHPNAIIRHDW
jgi:hypothetical protein